MHINFHMSVGDPLYGYGKMEIALWQALLEGGVRVTPSGPTSPALVKALPENVTATLAQPFTTGPITLATRQPGPVNGWHLHDTRLWMYTMAEADKIRPERIAELNARVERVIVPCPQLVDVYQASGLTIPIHCVPLGVDYYVPEPVERRRPEGVFRFLGYSLDGTRKGAHFTVMAFSKAFPDGAPVELWIKTLAERESWLVGCMEDGIVTLPGKVSERAWWELLGDVQAFVFPSMGEGFGLPPREAVLAGLPTIATPWLGLWDVAEWGYAVKTNGTRPVQYNAETINADDARWISTDWQDLAQQMRWVYDNYDEALEKARAGREHLLTHFTWAKAAEGIIELLEQYR